MKKIFIVLISISCSLAAKDSFLIPEDKSKASKNVVKEDIGESLKGALYACASVSSHLGELQKKIADLQHKFLSKGSSLINNDRCFKKAKRKELAEALKIMSKIEIQLKNQKDNVKRMVAYMDKSRCLK